MDTLVNRLLDVDREARQMLDEAKEYYEHTLLEIEEEKQRLQAEYRQKADRHLEQMKSELSSEVDSAVAEVRRRTSERLESMQAHYDQNCGQWAEELVRRCIGGEGDAP